MMNILRNCCRKIDIFSSRISRFSVCTASPRRLQTTFSSGATVAKTAQKLIRINANCRDFSSEDKTTIQHNMESKEEIRKRLTPMQYQVTQEAATERPFTGCYNKHYDKGYYRCIVCHQYLFSSDTKYDSGCGWPAFNDVLDQGKITLHKDTSIPGMERIEVQCSKCSAHMGHLFDDGPRPTGKRFCINSASIDFVEVGPDGGNLLLIIKHPERIRTEVRCKCGAHMGHVFGDGPKPTGKRYCINSAAIDFVDTDAPSTVDDKQSATSLTS